MLPTVPVIIRDRITLSLSSSPHPRMSFVAFMWLVSALPYTISGLCSDEGWFGPECEFKCHCYPGVNCTASGNCEKQTDSGQDCEVGWFGPQCQYRDLFFAYGKTDPQSGVGDNGVSDCFLDSTNQTSIVLKFSQEFAFSWLEMKFTNNEDTIKPSRENSNVANILKVPTFKLLFNPSYNSEECSNQKVFPFTESMEVWCTVVNSVEAISISGEILSSLCRVHVSGGRNVALRQPSNQSSTLDKDGFLFVSSLAVDGNNSITHGSTCAVTESTLRVNTWSVFFRIPALLRRVIVYSRDQDEQLLAFFTLQTFDSTATQIERYDGPGSPLRLVYDILLHEVSTAVSWLSIKGRLESIILCEVETFGDVPCAPDKWGYLCTNSCACDAQSSCSLYTGRCPGACLTGRYGEVCAQACPANCKGGICNKQTGDCFDCLKGFYSPLCNKQCPANCQSKQCELISGKCLPGDNTGNITKDSTGELGFYLLVGIPCLATALCLFLLLCYRRRKLRRQEEEHHEI